MPDCLGQEALCALANAPFSGDRTARSASSTSRQKTLVAFLVSACMVDRVIAPCISTVTMFHILPSGAGTLFSSHFVTKSHYYIVEKASPGREYRRLCVLTISVGGLF